MKYKIHLINPFKKRVETLPIIGFYHDETTAMSAADVMQSQHRDCTVEVEEFSPSGKLPLIIG